MRLSLSRFVTLGLALLIAGGLTSTTASQEPEEPIYQKKRVSEWIDQLKLKDDTARQEAVTALGKLGEKAVAPLIACLGDQQGDFRYQVLAAFKSIGEPAVPALLKAVDSRDEVIRTQAITALGWIGLPAKAAAPALKKVLKQSTPAVRLTAASALAQIDPENVGAAVEALLDLMKYAPDRWRGQNELNAYYACDVLTAIGAPAVPDLVKSLLSPNEHLRQNAATTLGRIKPAARDALKPLADCFNDRNHLESVP